MPQRKEQTYIGGLSSTIDLKHEKRNMRPNRPKNIKKYVLGCFGMSAPVLSAKLVILDLSGLLIGGVVVGRACCAWVEESWGSCWPRG